MTAFSSTIDRVYFGQDQNRVGSVSVSHLATTNPLATDLNYEAEYISIRDDGYLGQFDSSDHLILEVAAKSAALVFSQDQDSKKTLHLISPSICDMENHYERSIRIYEEKVSGRGVTKYPTNHVKCVCIHRDNGRTIFQLWEIAIVSQLKSGASMADFFLTTQMTAESEVFRDESENILLPDFEGYKYWESLKYYMERLIDPNTLTSISSRSSDPIIETPRFENNAGRVLWYNEAQQFGLVRFGKRAQVARVHWSQIRSSAEHKKLSARQMVRFAELVQPTQTTTRPTTIQWELKGVEAIG